MATILRGSDSFDTNPDNLGKVVQVVQYLVMGDDDSSKVIDKVSLGTGTGTYSDILTMSITTKHDNSAIMMDVNCVAYSNAAGARGRTRVVRDLPTITAVSEDRYGYYCDVSTMQNYQTKVIDYPNVPAGTTLTYKFQVNNIGSGILHVRYNDGGGGSTDSLTLTEII